MSVDNTKLYSSHISTKSKVTYYYIFQLSSPNNFSRTGYSSQIIPDEFITNLGEIERGFEDEMNIGLELTQTCKISFNLRADIGSTEEMIEFKKQLTSEQIPYTVNNIFFGDVRIPLRLTVKRGTTVIFDGLMVFKTQNELKITKSQTILEIEFTDIARAAGELVKFDNDNTIQYITAFAGTATADMPNGIIKDAFAPAMVNRYINMNNVVHHVLLMTTYMTLLTPKKIFEYLGRFYALAYSILTRYQINVNQNHLLANIPDDTINDNLIVFLFNPFRNPGTGQDSNYYIDNPIRGWHFNTQEIVNKIDYPDGIPASLIDNDNLYMIAKVGAKDDEYGIITYNDGFMTNGKDGGNLGSYKNLYEFVKAWAKSFHQKVRVNYSENKFAFEVRSIFENTQDIIKDVAKESVEAEYEIARGAFASNFKVNLSDASNGNENSVEIMNGSENDTTLEHEISIQTGNKFIDTNSSNISYCRNGWNYVLGSGNPYTCLYYDGTDAMKNNIINGDRKRMFRINSDPNELANKITKYFFKVNEVCNFTLWGDTEISLTDKPELPDFIVLANGGEGGSYFDDAAAGGFTTVNEGDSRRDAKYDEFNAYQHECFNNLGQATLINKWNEKIFGNASTELIKIKMYSSNFSVANIGQQITDSAGLGLSVIDNSNRFGIITKIVESPMDGSISMTILAGKP